MTIDHFQGPPTDAPAVDTAEQVYISSLALLKVILNFICSVPPKTLSNTIIDIALFRC